MRRYIDADKLRAEFDYNFGTYCAAWEFIDKPSDIQFLIDEQPTADVRENVRGEWIRRDSRYVGWISFDCSVCGETLELDRETSNDFKYCPFCGAEMREVNYELETRTID